MADYYSILKRTISGLPKNTAETRKLVFDKARSTIERQLRSLDPAPSEKAISTQLSALESAIEQLEFEESNQAPPRRATAPAGSSPPRDPEPQPPAPPPPAPPRPAAPKPGPVSAAPAAARPQPRPAPAAAEFAHDEFFEAEADDIVESESNTPRPVRRAPRRSGGFGKLLVILLILAILAAGGYGLWINREPLMALTGLDRMTSGGDTPQVTASEETAPVTETTEEIGAKDEVRLGQDGQTIEIDAQEEVVDRPESTEQTDLPLTTEEDQPVEVSPVDEGASEAVANSDDVEEAAPVDEGVEQAQSENAPFAIPAVGQKAYLYEEGVGNSAATRDNAAIVWSTEQEAPAEGMPPESVIKGQLEVPGRGLTMDISIKRNVDESLSASHIIELVFETPPDFSGGNIDTLARFVMKANEQARGEPLVAVPVKIDSGFFMIALNNLEQARESNRRLLLDSSWIDIPLGYSTGRRALVTLEKGAIGDQVFRDAFADWDNR
jgi:hypothetical protein